MKAPRTPIPRVKTFRPHTCPGPCATCDTLPDADVGQDVHNGKNTRAYLGLGQTTRFVCPGPCSRCGATTLNGSVCHDCLPDNWKPAREHPVSFRIEVVPARSRRFTDTGRAA